MKITSLEEKKKQKAMEDMAVLPVYNSVWVNNDGELDGDLIAYKEVPKYFLEDD
ncbi:hypothetical protein [Oceanobacillus locisalsi]|uniref:Uncharacterized protein n=1 Tax=Oceanobacillus locisalsi TaxID=546107 RepID=A0ABW3NJW9_9BACI